MTADTITLVGRRAAEALMVDVCTITRGGAQTFNPVAGDYITSSAAQVYTGKCRVRTATTPDRTADTGDRQVSLRTFTIQLPTVVTTVFIDDVVAVTSSTLDPDLVGAHMRVTSVGKGTHVTARRLTAEEITTDTQWEPT